MSMHYEYNVEEFMRCQFCYAACYAPAKELVRWVNSHMAQCHPDRLIIYVKCPLCGAGYHNTPERIAQWSKSHIIQWHPESSNDSLSLIGS